MNQTDTPPQKPAFHEHQTCRSGNRPHVPAHRPCQSCSPEYHHEEYPYTLVLRAAHGVSGHLCGLKRCLNVRGNEFVHPTEHRRPSHRQQRPRCHAAQKAAEVARQHLHSFSRRFLAQTSQTVSYLTSVPQLPSGRKGPPSLADARRVPPPERAPQPGRGGRAVRRASASSGVGYLPGACPYLPPPSPPPPRPPIPRPSTPLGETPLRAER